MTFSGFFYKILGMDIPEELKEKSTPIMVYRMRKYNLIIMGLGTAMFLALGVVGGVLWIHTFPQK